MKQDQKGTNILDRPPEPTPDELEKESLKNIKYKFIVMSGKGGVGKTSVSVNLAIALARNGFKVGLMDIDIHGPDIPGMLGLRGMLQMNKKKKINPLNYSENLTAVSIESLMPDKDNAIIWRGPVKHNIIRQFINDVEWGNLDFLIIDAPPGTGDEPLTIAQLIRDARAVIVTTPQEIALADVRKSIQFCRQVNMEIFGLVENMSGYTCPNCGQSIDFFGSGGGGKTAAAAGVNFLGQIPFDPLMVSCGDLGISYQEKYPDTIVTMAFQNIVKQMILFTQMK